MRTAYLLFRRKAWLCSLTRRSRIIKTVSDAIDEVGGKLDILVATHPHSDHIGGMQKVYEKYRPGKILYVAL
jgi:phosphoribosyl 1,2-cyclic phosphodiesterase